MNNAHKELSARYLASLRTHLKRGKADAGDSARQLGRAAVAQGLATLELARMHEHAVVALGTTHDFATSRSAALRRARAFFNQALAPMERDRRAERETHRRLVQHVATLRRHGAAIARSNRQLEREVRRRKTAEIRIQLGKERYRRLFFESRLMENKLRHLTRQILSAQEEERKKISRELHDEVVQTLVGINVELTGLGQSAAIADLALKQKIARTRRLVEKSVNAVHRFARELRPAVLDDIGLIPALHAYSENLAARHGLRIKMTAFSGVENLCMTGRTVLFRVAQEALNNVVRHAGATFVTLGLSDHAGAIQLEICDNGKAFDVAERLHAKNNKRLGLVGMRERIEMIGGRLDVESARGRGTTIRALVPFRPEHKPSS